MIYWVLLGLVLLGARAFFILDGKLNILSEALTSLQAQKVEYAEHSVHNRTNLVVEEEDDPEIGVLTSIG